MLMPKRVKYRKMHRGHMRGTAGRGNQVAFGEYGMQALEPCWMTRRQIEAARQTLVRFIPPGREMGIRGFPGKPVGKKPAETRMGSGKGPVDHWVAVVRPGLMLFELAGVTEEAGKEAFLKASFKLTIREQIVSRAAESAAPEVAGEVTGAVATGAAA